MMSLNKCLRTHAVDFPHSHLPWVTAEEGTIDNHEHNQMEILHFWAFHVLMWGRFVPSSLQIWCFKLLSRSHMIVYFHFTLSHFVCRYVFFFSPQPNIKDFFLVLPFRFLSMRFLWKCTKNMWIETHWSTLKFMWLIVRLFDSASLW